jgi:hypothetical protein
MPMSLALLPLLLQSAIAGQPLPAVGWNMSQPDMQEVIAADGISREFYPPGQSAQAWSDRYAIRRLGPAASHAQAMDQQETTARADCPSLSSTPLQAPDAEMETLRMWNCPSNRSGDFGTTALVRTILAPDGMAYLSIAERRGKPVAAGKIQQLSKDEMTRYGEFVLSVNACNSLTVPGCAPLTAIMGEYGDAPLSAQDRDAAALASQRGLALYRQDQLAWHATDYLLEHKLGGKLTPSGFFSVPAEGRIGSTYFMFTDKTGKQPHVRIDSDAAGELSAQPVADELPVGLRARWQALQTAKSDPRLQMCGPKSNTIVLQDGDGWLVYVMTATMDERQVFLGGHNRIRVDASGLKAGEVDHSAKGCISVDARQLRSLGLKSSFFYTHLVSPYPWETDVMQSLTWGVPLTRVAGSGIWRIEGDALRKYSTTPVPTP